MAKTQVKNSSVQAVSRALKILEAFSPEQPELSLNDFSKITGFYKSTILRQIDTLLNEGFLAKDSENGRYRLGAKVYLLGQIFINTSSLLKSSDAILKEVVEELRETTGIFVIDEMERLCLKMVSGPHYIRATFETGHRMPIYAGASGKVLLAFSPQSFVNRVIKETGLKRLTELTITDSSELKSELAKIKEQGWSISWGERVQNAITVSVPVFGDDGRIVCSLSTSGPSDRLNKENAPNIVKALQRASLKLSTDIGYHGNYWDKVIKEPVVLES